MKTNLLYLGLVMLAGVALSSCDETARLAKDIQGSWTGTPVPMAGEVLTSQLVDTYSFELSADDPKAGTLTINSTISSNATFPGSADGTLPPVTLTSAATSSISGTWLAVDDDDIAVNLDMSSMSVTVDPDAISMTGDILGDGATAAVDSMRPQFVQAVRTRLTTDLQTRYMSIRNLSDVKIKNGHLLKFEIGNYDYVLTRNGKQGE